MLVCHIWPLLCWGMFPACLFSRGFYHKWVLNHIKRFSCIYWDDDRFIFFYLQFVDVVYQIDWFAVIKNLCIPGINTTLLWCMILLMYCWFRLLVIYWGFSCLCSSMVVQFSHSVMSDSLWAHGPQHARPPCSSSTPRTCSNSCPSHQWCHTTILSSVIPFSSQLQSFPGSFQMSQLFASGGQSMGASASASVLPMNTQDWSPLRWTGWISLQSKGLSRVFSDTIVQKHQFFSSQLHYGPTFTSIHDHWKNHSFDKMDLYWQSNVFV